jgi:hypothetical protein
MKLVALTLLLAALAGCASSSSSSAGRGVVGDLQDSREVDLLFRELETEEGNLKTLMASFSGDTQAVDCPRACDLRASIANLARRICAVTARLDRERQIQCVDARRRSEIASTDVKKVCECGK